MFTLLTFRVSRPTKYAFRYLHLRHPRRTRERAVYWFESFVSPCTFKENLEREPFSVLLILYFIFSQIESARGDFDGADRVFALNARCFERFRAQDSDGRTRRKTKRRRPRLFGTTGSRLVHRQARPGRAPTAGARGNK